MHRDARDLDKRERGDFIFVFNFFKEKKIWGRKLEEKEPLESYLTFNPHSRERKKLTFYTVIFYYVILMIMSFLK